MCHGEGILYYPNGTIKYKGTFIDNTISYGRFNYKNGNYYIGEFKNWNPEGKGTSYDKNG